MADSITLAFSTTHAWQSHLICLMCHSPYSHVNIVVPDLTPYGLLGASDPGGVCVRPHDYEVFKVQRFLSIKTPKADDIIKYAHSQIGKPFDDTALHAFLSDKLRDWRLPDSWFCSELVTWCFEQAKFFPYELIVGLARIAPSDLLLLLNPYFDAIDFDKSAVWTAPPTLITA
jgi:hypothetical protein